MTLAEKLLEHGIRPRSFSAGNSKLICPRCSHTRTNRRDPCLSLTVDDDGAVWRCHHCEFQGAVSDREPVRREHRRAAPVKPARLADAPTDAVLDWFARRGISAEVVHRNGIGSTRTWIPALQSEADAIAFPYRRGGEVVNFKFRALAGKHFAQVKGAEKILFGLDDIADADTAIIVEGEPDKLAMEMAGFLNVVSVPDGAPAKVSDGPAGHDDRKFEYLRNCADELSKIKRFILATDADGPGQALAEELARRLGKERCSRVTWPDAGDAPSKDANDALVTHGPGVLRECIEAAEPHPIAGLHDANEFAAETYQLYRDGRSRGRSTGWRTLDEFLTIVPGQLSVVTGIPNSGKSELVDALMVNLAHMAGWRFAVCSFENPPAEHIAKLAEKHLGAPFWDGRTRRMSEFELVDGIAWVGEHFIFVRADDDAPTIDWILERARAAVLRYGIRGLVIDPYNEIEHRRPPNMTETEYVSAMLARVKRFAQSAGVHVWFVVHPAKMQRDGNSIPAPTLYDISGSANWANKADVGLVVHRPDPAKPMTDIYVRKVRFKAVGKIGACSLHYEPPTGRYYDPDPLPAGAARAYRDD